MKTVSIALVISVLAALCPTGFAETSITITGIQVGPSDTIVIAWPSESGRWYRLEQTTNLVSTAFETVFPSTDATPPTNFYTNTVSGTGACFYRIIGDTADLNQTDRGTSGNDTQIVIGTANRDRIVQFGYAGDDTQYASGLDQDDWIEQDGGTGNDTQTARGGGGNDTIFQMGGSGNNVLTSDSGTGDDRVWQYGGNGYDRIVSTGGDGNDVLYANGGDGNDYFNIDAGAGTDDVLIYGGAGNDNIAYNVSAGNDRVYIDGGVDNDTLTVNVGSEDNFRLVDAVGNIMYQSGTGGNVITVVNVENGTVVGPLGETLFEWPTSGFTGRSIKR